MFIFTKEKTRGRANLQIVWNLIEYCMLIFVFRTINVGIRDLSEIRIPNLCSFFKGNAWKSTKTSMYRVIHKKVSHETEDKMPEKIDKLQKSPSSL